MGVTPISPKDPCKTHLNFHDGWRLWSVTGSGIELSLLPPPKRNSLGQANEDIQKGAA